MERTEKMDQNYKYSSCGGDSKDSSSPMAREIEENQMWDESQHRVKCMCSFGGKVHPRPHDNQLSYLGGDTKILAIDRASRYADVLARLSQIWEMDVTFKYQLPGEDLDALISVTNDEDLDHMMAEFDRLYNENKAARIRIFLFPVEQPAVALPNSVQIPATAGENKSDQKWFVDALNAAPALPTLNRSGSGGGGGVGQGNQDLLFGLERTSRVREEVVQIVPSAPLQPARVLNDSPPLVTKRDPRPPEIVSAPVVAGVHPAEIQRQIQEFQRLQIAAQEQHAAAAALLQRKQEENLGRNVQLAPGFPTRETGPPQDYYVHRVQEKNRYDPPSVQPQQVMSSTAPPATTSYWSPPTPDRNPQPQDQAVYVLPSNVYPAGAVRPAFYAVQPKMVTQPQPPPVANDPYVGARTTQPYPEVTTRPPTDAPPNFPHMVYEQGGRAVYYATQAAPPQYHAVGVDLRHGPGQTGQDSGRNK